MLNTVRTALESMRFLPYTHIVVRFRESGKVEPLGGGHVDKVLSRYGERTLVRSFISDGILFIDTV